MVREFLECASVEQLKAAFLAVPRQGRGSGAGRRTFRLRPGSWCTACGSIATSLTPSSSASPATGGWIAWGRVELNLLRLGVYEMLYRADVPPKVSMNEALELDKQYGDSRSHTFVNGILDAVSKAVDKGELRSPRLMPHRKYLSICYRGRTPEASRNKNGTLVSLRSSCAGRKMAEDMG